MADQSRLRRMPLRDLLNHMDLRCRELLEHIQMDVTPIVAEFHKISRPVRKKSAYPSIRSICNVHERLRKSHEYAENMSRSIEETLQAIEDRVQNMPK